MGETQTSIKGFPKHGVAMSVNKQRQSENRKVKVEIAQGRICNF